MEDREKNILKNSVIFTIGNLGSKVLSYVMVLFYTYFINSSELGFYDITLTTISLLIPVVMLSFDEGIYRWLIDAQDNKKSSIISTCIKILIFPCIVSIIIFVLLNMRFHFPYAIEIIFLFLTSLFYQLILNAVRGLSNNKLYAVSGLLNSFFVLVFEIIGLVFLNMGVESLIISKTIANILTVLFIYIKQCDFHDVLKVPFDRKLALDIVMYTVPLIPNSISWWIVNSSDRYIILFFLGQKFNGIYTIANKFPTIISTIASILYFALQEAVIKEYKSPDKDIFYSKIFEKYYTILFSIVLCVIPLTKIIIRYMTGSEYTNAWQFTGFLFLSAVFSALSSFLGIGYQISHNTKRSAYTTILAAMVNICINLLTVRWIGLHAATISTLLSYIVLFIVRIIHNKEYFNLRVKWKKFIFMFFICIVNIYITYMSNFIIVINIFILSLILMVIFNKEFIVIILSKIKNII